MIKLLTFLKRRPPLTRPGFKQRWMDIHAPMALKFPGLRGYMLSFSVEPEDGAEPLADGVAQLWFDSREATQSSYASDIGRKGSADASAYLDRREHMLASEVWVHNTRSLKVLPFKYMIGVKREAGVPRAAFVDWWRQDVTRSVAALPGFPQLRMCHDEAGQLLNSGTEGTLTLRSGEAPFDGLCEIWFETRDAMLAAARHDPLSPMLDGRAGHTESFVLEEFVMRQPPAPAYGKEQAAQDPS